MTLKKKALVGLVGVFHAIISGRCIIIRIVIVYRLLIVMESVKSALRNIKDMQTGRFLVGNVTRRKTKHRLNVTLIDKNLFCEKKIKQ